MSVGSDTVPAYLRFHRGCITLNETNLTIWLENIMANTGGEPSLSKIIVGSDSQPTREASTSRTRSWMGVAACLMPVAAVVFAFVFSGILAGGNQQSAVYAIGTIGLFFILGVGTGVGLGVLSNPRKTRFAPALAILLNIVALIVLLAVSLAYEGGSDEPPSFETLEGEVGAAVSSTESGVGL